MRDVVRRNRRCGGGPRSADGLADRQRPGACRLADHDGVRDLGGERRCKAVGAEYESPGPGRGVRDESAGAHRESADLGALAVHVEYDVGPDAGNGAPVEAEEKGDGRVLAVWKGVPRLDGHAEVREADRPGAAPNEVAGVVCLAEDGIAAEFSAVRVPEALGAKENRRRAVVEFDGSFVGFVERKRPCRIWPVPVCGGHEAQGIAAVRAEHELVAGILDLCAKRHLCFVAAGRVDVYWEIALKEYDVAAGALIASEAGAAVLDMNGGSNWPSEGILCTNAPLVPVMLEHFREAIGTVDPS